MKVEQIYTGCLAQGAYYIESKGEVAIIDPLREVSAYVERAEKDGAKIKYVFETHFHADFVSGHVTLAEKTGAKIVFGPTASPGYDAYVGADGELFELGDVKIKLLHTPGHTMESSCYLLIDETGKETALFTGDTLFLGDVGRPDLAQKAASMTQEELAATLYDSLRNKVMTLPDDTVIYPGHGAGSACGKNMSKETVGTLGEQKSSNYALRADMTKEEFVKEVTDGLLPPPSYFPMNVAMNKGGYDSIDDVLSRGCKALSPEAFELLANEVEAVILDVRHQSEFIKDHIPNSIFIGIDGGFAPWVGALIKDVKQPILLVTPEGREKETVTRLSRVGFDHTMGYLDGGLDAWKAAGKETDNMRSVSAEEFERQVNAQGTPVFDVRKPGEYASEHLEMAESTPLDYLNDYLASFPKEEDFFIHCAGGYRSVIAGSILKSRGIHNLIDVAGGYGAIKNTGLTRTDYVCPTKIK
ncbi:MAG: MBL fold metallo-hydrolase [Bacteroidetes bacterium]|nr:MAG: MBL fold metallo-hydrolase [Bacteroidota bacterium]